MATTDPSTATAPETAELWEKSFQGEVLGEAYFAAAGRLAEEPAVKDTLAWLEAVERCTKEVLVPSMERLGIPTEPDPATLEAMAAMTSYDHREGLELVVAITPEFLGYYTRLRALVEAEDAPVVDLLIAHELALELFARRALAAHPDPLQPIRALPHVSAPAGAAIP